MHEELVDALKKLYAERIPDPRRNTKGGMWQENTVGAFVDDGVAAIVSFVRMEK